MTVLKLVALVVGDGSVVSVNIDADESVGDLRRKIHDEQHYATAFPASALTLFAACKAPPRKSKSRWLSADDPDVKLLKKTAVPQGIQTQILDDEDKEMDPTYPLSDFFSKSNAPKPKEIHVLVQLPKTHTQKTSADERRSSSDTAAAIAPASASASTTKQNGAKRNGGNDGAAETRSLRKKKQRVQTETRALAKPPSSSWQAKATAVFFFLHGKLGNGDPELTCKVFNVKPGTFRNWITKKIFYPKWLYFVKTMTLQDVVVQMPSEFRAMLRVESLPMDANVTIPHRFLRTRGGGSKRRHSDGEDGGEEGETREARLEAMRLASSPVADGRARHTGSGRTPKYPTQEKFMVEQVQLGWEAGSPLSRKQINALLTEAFGSASAEEDDRGGGDGEDAGKALAMEFVTKMSLATGRTAPALSQWVSRRLDGNGWSICAEHAVPQVPLDWYETAIKTSSELRCFMRSVDVLISADEMFLHFFPREIPRGGGASGKASVESKLGSTVVLSCEFFSSMVLPPFILMTGDQDGPLARKFGTWSEDGGDAEICLQPSHRMDIGAAKKYLEFIASLFPGKRIGLIWDTASAHVCEEIVAYTAELGIVAAHIPVGLASVMQVSTLVANKAMKESIESQVARWKCQQLGAPVSGSYRVERVEVIKWVELAVLEVNESARAGEVERMFRQLGQDPTGRKDESEQAFVEYLDTLSENAIHSSLTEMQQPFQIE